ncbi:hypothetical protein [Nonomuraea deserti]|uniref:hypothetical protein n=1 Tax=Nonomuraea deserti TaxID=1848322 RepID=UPI0015F2BDA4|nr:hypothetical protein [Nonomuraea deserti]
MSPEADTLVQEMLLDATGKAADLVRMFAACFTAEPTLAHQALKAALLDEAKALLVIGLHADRRTVQARARERGMRIFYVDPEGLVQNGVFEEYPIEEPATATSSSATLLSPR